MRRFYLFYFSLIFIFVVGCQHTATPSQELKNSTVPKQEVEQKTDDQTCYISWVDFIKLNGVFYVGDVVAAEGNLKEESLGNRYAEIKFKVEGNVFDPSYQSEDGDAAYISPGTAVYSLKDYNADFRIAVKHDDGKIKIYEAFTNPKATQGSEMIDIEKKVTYIGINSEVDGRTELASIHDEELVKEMVDMLLRASINTEQRSEGPRYFIEFHLKDGTSVNRSYWLDTGELAKGIMLPKDFRLIVEETMK